MAVFLPFTERYLLKLIYYTVTDPPSTSGKDLWYEKHTALVRVTNTGDKLLSKCNIESLALSIPELNHRVVGYSDVPILLYPILIWEETLPWDCSLPQRIRAQLPSSSYSQPRPQIHCHALTPTASPATKSTLSPLLAPSNNYSCVTTDSPSLCDSSFSTTGLNHEEWTTVTYGDHDFIRSICPVYSTDTEVNVIGCCCLSDYTAYGQLVLSVDIDFLHEDCQVDSDLSSDSMPEGLRPGDKLQANCRLPS